MVRRHQKHQHCAMHTGRPWARVGPTVGTTMRADRPWLQYDKRKDEMKIIKIVKRVHVNRKHGSDGGVTGDIYIYTHTHTHTF